MMVMTTTKRKTTTMKKTTIQYNNANLEVDLNTGKVT